MHEALIQNILQRKYNVNDWEELAKAISEKLGAPLDLVLEKRFIPGGRILAAVTAGDRKVSYINCTTYSIEDDSIEGISKAIYRVMRASSRGQGIGIDISALRPKGARVNNAALSSSGAVSFMFPIEAARATIGQLGRRGALLFSIDGTHPDVLDFIDVKSSGGLTGANISVKLSDSTAGRLFETGAAIKLRFVAGNEMIEREVSAAKYLESLAYNAWLTGDPGLIFWQRSQELSNSDLCGVPIVGVNACAETRLAQDDVCVLGSFNLSAYIRNAFSDEASFDWEKLRSDVFDALLLLDRAVDVEINEGRSPSLNQMKVLYDLRRLGLGFMGLADAIIKLGWRYDSPEALEFAGKVSRKLYEASYEASALLAQEYGPYPRWGDMDISAFFARHHMLPTHVADLIESYGMRNVTTMSIAPTGTISILAGVSSGLEPAFSRSYKRMVRINGRDEEVDIVHPVIREYNALGYEGVPESFQSAHEIDPYARIAMQAVIQRYVDQACSSTVNLPNDATVEDVKNIFRTAWRSGLTGITVFRDGCRDTQVLKSTDVNRADVALEGKTICVKHDRNVYVTVNQWGGNPFEIFINGFGSTPAEEQMADGFARLSSHLLRRGMSIDDLCKELRQVPCTYIGSVPLLIAKALETLEHGRQVCEVCGSEVRVENGCETCACGSKCD